MPQVAPAQGVFRFNVIQQLAYLPPMIRYFRDLPLRLKLTLAMLVVAALAASAVTLVSDYTIRRQVTQKVGDNLRAVAIAQAQMLGNALDKQANILAAISVNRVLRATAELLNRGYYATEADFETTRHRLLILDSEWQNGHATVLEAAILESDASVELGRFRDTFPEQAQILLTDSYGALVGAANRPSHYYYGDTEWWQSVYRSGGDRIYIGVPDTNGDFVIATAVRSLRQEQVVGVLAAVVNLNSLAAPALEAADANIAVAIYFPAAGLLARRADSGVNVMSIDEELRFFPNETDILAVGELWLDGIPQLASQAPVISSNTAAVANVDWRLIACLPRDEALEPVNAAAAPTLLTGLAVMLLTGIAAFWLGRLLSRPVMQLTAMASRAAEGDLSLRAPVEAADEIGRLATAFNHMIGRLQANLEDLRRYARAREVSAEVARVTSASLELEAVLNAAVSQICDRLGFFYAAVFIVDPVSGQAIRRKSAGVVDDGRTSRPSQVAVGSSSAVGIVTATHCPIIIQDTKKEVADTSRSNLFPATAAQIVLPLVCGEDAIGALEVHSAVRNVFTPEMTMVLSTLADQIAVAIHNAHLYTEQCTRAEKLAELDRLKNEFVAVMSHELRTPLNSIIGFADLLLEEIEGPLTDNQRTDLQIIRCSATHLLGLINNILDFSKLGADKIHLDIEDVDVHVLLDNAIAAAAGLLKDKPVTLRQEVPPNLPTLRADARRLQQVLLNLLSNAVKFTDSGEIVVRAREVKAVTTERRIETQLEISVSDTGCGIPSEAMHKLFKPFSQVDSSSTRKHGGVGLGLNIARQLIEMHGGRIWVESTVGRGSTFTFTIPLEQHLEEQPAAVGPLEDWHTENPFPRIFPANKNCLAITQSQ